MRMADAMTKLVAIAKEKAPMKLDLPEPLGPINTLIGRSCRRSILLMLLKPLMVIQSSTAMLFPSTLERLS